jgi:hypothetical protein
MAEDNQDRNRQEDLPQGDQQGSDEPLEGRSESDVQPQDQAGTSNPSTSPDLDDTDEMDDDDDRDDDSREDGSPNRRRNIG